MKERRCDRCGQPVCRTVRFTPVTITGNMSHKSIIKELWAKTVNYDRCQFELCDECAKSFANWFNGAEKQPGYGKRDYSNAKN